MNEEKKPSAIEILNLFSMNQYKQYPECYRRYLENMPEFYMEDLMDYIVSSPEEDVTNSDYIFEEEDIIGIGFYKKESPILTSIHKVFYFETPSYECMDNFFKKIIAEGKLPHQIAWKLPSDDPLVDIGKELCSKYNGYRELVASNTIIHFVVREL